MNQKFHFKIFFCCFLVYKCWRVVQSNHEKQLLCFWTPTPPPPEKTCHKDSVVSQGEVKGYRHREHILILSGKISCVEAQVPDSKNYRKTTKTTNIEVQVKNHYCHETEWEGVTCVFHLKALKSWQFLLEGFYVILWDITWFPACQCFQTIPRWMHGLLKWKCLWKNVN